MLQIRKNKSYEKTGCIQFIELRKVFSALSISNLRTMEEILRLFLLRKTHTLVSTVFSVIWNKIDYQPTNLISQRKITVNTTK